MPQIVSDIFRKDLLERTIDFKIDAIAVTLMTKEHQYKASDAFWCNIQHNEIKGEGYISGGQCLKNVRFKKNPESVFITAGDLIWPSAKFTTKGMALYFPHNGRVIGGIEFDRTYTVNGAMFTLEWNRNGIISEAFPDTPPEYLNYYFNKENSND